MTNQVLTPDLLPHLTEWLEFNLSAGCSEQQLCTALVREGYLHDDAYDFVKSRSIDWVNRQSGGPFDAEPVGEPQVAVERFWRRLDVLGSFNWVSLGDRKVQVLFKDQRRGVYFIPQFLTDEECQAIIAEGRPRLSTATVVDEASGTEMKTSTRTSRGAVLPRGASEATTRIESRIAKLTALPMAHGEGLQVLHYRLGGEYRPHVDYFDPDTVGGALMLAKGAQRLASVILYLSDVEAGGGTAFPELSLEFTPQKGAALLFASLARDGGVLPASLHCGLPVTSGEKWIATKWIRLAPH